MSFENTDEKKGSYRGSAPASIRVRNLVATANWLSDYLWLRLPNLESDVRVRNGAAERIRRVVEQTRSVCRGAGGEPAALVEPSRSAFAWLAFLDAGNLDEHLGALVRARKALPADLKVSGVPLLLHIRTMSALWKFRRYSNCLHVACSEGFIAADGGFWVRFFDAMGLRAREAALSLARDLAATEEFAAVTLEVEAHVEPSDPDFGTAGRTHDLSASFDRMNREHFGGIMERPGLAWSRSPTVRTFGLYMSSRDRVMVSQSLDDPSVPEFLVDFIMYHELLHKKLGIVRRAGRNQAHTPEFRFEEKKFPRYDEAQALLKDLARKLRE